VTLPHMVFLAAGGSFVDISINRMHCGPFSSLIGTELSKVHKGASVQ
jgi:hypothetical protein